MNASTPLSEENISRRTSSIDVKKRWVEIRLRYKDLIGTSSETVIIWVVHSSTRRLYCAVRDAELGKTVNGGDDRDPVGSGDTTSSYKRAKRTVMPQ